MRRAGQPESLSANTRGTVHWRHAWLILLASLPGEPVYGAAEHAAPEPARSACDGSAKSNGAWRSGGESREEAELYLTSELNESLARSQACARELARQDAASAGVDPAPNAGTNGAVGAWADAEDDAADSRGDQPTAGSGRMPSDTGSTRDEPDAADDAGDGQGQDAIASYPAESAIPSGTRAEVGGDRTPTDAAAGGAGKSTSEDASDGSYAKALREAFSRETDPRLRQAIADEYRRLTGKTL
jgi:hypothetical protein